ncbi:amino acid ABC transporter ATP-binding/permease protein [Colwellia psychrerythraea]|uniref:Cysteine ABC transporter, ATP-binding/permease protein n=1 Tax=Colwellia psychrerythraea (strain 34H / ATCC BAA-681) TaxID=167879 RepID=Q484A5_COLP3|nr:amino acid ABC transporter ATP-binding/permease protein [Colwellia psychrerythraea]AAZ25635.1 cysteine ABC transporter, ATP-binding/permease protein [Colwellia psychrerythraea 34H]
MKVFIRLICLLKPQLPLMLLGALLSVITVLANISLLAVSGWFITLMAIAGTTGITVNYFTPAAIIRFLAIVRTAGRYAERMLTHRATFNALAHLRHYFYQQLEPLLPYYRINLRSGDLLARLQQDIDNLDNFYLRVLLPIVVALISVPIVCYALAIFSPTIAWVMLAAFLIVGLVFPVISYLASTILSQEKSHLESHLTEELVNGIGAIKTLLVYQVSISYQRSIANITKQYYGVRYRLVKINARLTAIIFLLIHLSALACLLLLLPQLSTGEVDSKSLVAVILLVLVSFETVSSMPLALQLLPQSLASAARLFAIIDKEIPVDIGVERVKHGDIHFENFTFSYPEKKTPSLIDINLSIKAGEKVAIIGASGAGKSTLVNLLMGFWPTGQALSSINASFNSLTNPSSNATESKNNKGRITIADCDLSLIEHESLRQHIALMSQQGHIFEASIADNLRLAKHDATHEEMRKVCQLVNIIDFIEGLPKGLDTWLGTSGAGLSGGQAQRLQIAQLLLRSASVLILDEPTKGLDRHNEEQIMRNILAHVKQQQQSLLVITHKPLMLEKMDKIIVMQQGEIVAQGSHSQLVNNNDYYQKLLNYF